MNSASLNMSSGKKMCFPIFLDPKNSNKIYQTNKLSSIFVFLLKR